MASTPDIQSLMTVTVGVEILAAGGDRIGNPAQVIRYRFKSETIERLLKLAWWEWDLAKITANLELLYIHPDEWQPEIQVKEPQGELLKFVDMPASTCPALTLS